MPARSFPGRKIADTIVAKARVRAKKLPRPPGLAIVLVGRNRASEVFVRQKENRAIEAGVRVETVRLPSRITEQQLLSTVRTLNRDRETDGIIVQLPLPRHISVDRVITTVAPDKDVDGFHPESIARLLRTRRMLPPTVAGILLALTYAGFAFRGKQVAFVGKPSPFAGALTVLLARAGAACTVVLPKHVRTSTVLREADAVVTLAGSPDLITARNIKRGAYVVDAGFGKRGGKFVGDVSPGVATVARFLTPVPGGIGPLTVAFLLENVVTAAENRKRGA